MLQKSIQGSFSQCHHENIFETMQHSSYLNNVSDIKYWPKATYIYLTHQTFSCSNSTKEILEKGVKYIQSSQ